MEVTIHEIINALEQIEETYGEGETVKSITLIPATEDEKAQLIVETNGAVFELNIGEDF